MKTKALKSIRHLIGVAAEWCLEWIEYIRFSITHRRESKSRLAEEYSIKREYMEQEYIKDFLDVREKSAVRQKYRMSVNHNYVSEDENEIGIVILRCNGRYIDHAVLTAGPSTGNGNRIIYWNFKKIQQVG